MPEDVNIVAEPSAAAVVETPNFNPSDQHTWSPEQREHWNKTGDIPEQPKKKQEAATASTPEKKAESEVEGDEPETESAADPEAAHKQDKAKQNRKLNAEERIAQLTRKNRELEERIRERESVAKPTAKPEEAVKSEPTKTQAPKRPNPFTWAGTPEEFEAAMDTYETHLRKIVDEAAEQRIAQKEQAKALQAKVDDARKLYADADTRILPAAEKLEKAQIPAAVRQVIEDSEILPHLLYALGDGDTLDNLIEMARTNPRKAIRIAMDMERDIETALSKQSKTEVSEEKPPVETKPRAPKPPSEVGGRSATGDDGLVVAARANDFRAFEAEQSRRLLASRK